MSGTSTRPSVVVIAAVSRNGVIGRDGDMPWRLSTDLKRFKALTLGKPVVLGRKTFDSLGGRPLPGRPHVVVSRKSVIAHPDVDTRSTLPAALDRAGEIAEAGGVHEICVIGGGEIYRQVLAIADRLHITHVDVDIPDGDTFFPSIDGRDFERLEETAVPAGERDNFPTRYAIYRRKSTV